MSTASTGIDLWVSVGDLHAGSAFAPCPASVPVDDGLTVQASLAQTWLRQCWDDFGGWFHEYRKGRPFGLLLTGDLIEGVHHGGHQLIWQSEPRHAEIATQLLRGLARESSGTYAVAGTECHTKSWEEKIAKDLGAIQCERTERYAADWLDINVKGCITSVRHHISTSGRLALYATALSVQLAEEQAGAARAGAPIPRVVIRSHRHTYGQYTDGDGLIVTTPAWQLLTRHAHKVVPAAQRTTKVGGIVLDYAGVEEKGVPTCVAKLYRPPA